MVLEINDIIQGPVVTEKAYKLGKKLNQLVIKVHPQANKPQIAAAFEKAFNVKVETVRTLIRKGKRKFSRRTRTETVGKAVKKAIITLQEGYSLDLLGMQSQANVPVQNTND